MSTYGDATIELVNSVFDQGAQHIVLLMRHSAREFSPDKHDMLNPLTDEGRSLSIRLGEQLPKAVLLRAYSSPVERCIETADLIMRGHRDKQGKITRNRPIEALGVFYVLDQMRMFMAMREAGGMIAFLEAWFADKVPADVMIPAQLAAQMVFDVAASKLSQVIETPQLDVLVSHDLTLFTVRDRLLQQAAVDYPVEFLDGLAIYEKDGRRFLQSSHGPAKVIE